jgi:endonuclease/exonuclease/phosphatase family metal-dependent hydrolase
MAFFQNDCTVSVEGLSLSDTPSSVMDLMRDYGPICVTVLPYICGASALVTLSSLETAEDLTAAGHIRARGRACRVTWPSTLQHERRPYSQTLPRIPNWRDDQNPIVRRRCVSLMGKKSPGTCLFDESSLDLLPEDSLLTVFSWNILFQKFSLNHEHYCPRQYLYWPWRLPRISSCIMDSGADIIALQEVPDGQQWDELVQSIPHYTVLEGRKQIDGPGVDGVAIGWTVRFKMTRCFLVPLSTATGDPHVALTVLLSENGTHREVVVATTHLKSPKLEDDVRLEQLRVLLGALRECYGAALLDRHVPLVLCGDFNTQPRWGLVSSLKRGAVCSSMPGPLSEVYTDFAEVAFQDKQYTCFMPHTQDQIDYIFHSPSLRPVSCWQVPSDRDVVRLHKRDCGGLKLSLEMLPTPAFPSDHIPLRATFLMPQVQDAW